MINVRSMAPTVSGAGHSSAKRAFCRLVATLLAAAGLGGWPADPAEGQTSDESATYTVTFQGEWTISSTPGGVVSGAHFTTLIGAVHNSQVTFWRSGGTASPGIENVAEIGGTSTFRSEIRAKGSDVASVVQASPGSGGRGRATFDIDVTNDHPLLTLVSMIGPSPDWFVGVSRLSLLDGGQWRSQHSVNLYPYDAGTEDGEEFSLSNSDTSPQGTITSIRGTGKFSNAPMATLSFVRKDTPPPPPPTVSAITRQMPATARTRDDALIWKVVFSEAVTGVDAADFDVAGTTADATAVNGNGATWWVTVSGGDLNDLDGEISLRFAGGQDIQNSAGQMLNPALPSGASYQTFTLDNTAPTATIGPSSASGPSFTVSIGFSEPVTGLTLSGIMVANGSAMNLRGSDRAYTATVTPASTTAPATITVTVAPGAARDLAGNGNDMATQSIDYAPAPPPPPPSRITVDVADARASEGDAVTFTVRLTGGTPGRDLELVATPASGPDDTATADTDYETLARDVSIDAGRTSATFSVATTQDNDDEPDETFTVTLAPRTGTTLPAGVSITHGTATGTIMDDDMAGAVHHVPFLASASNSLGRQSFVRIINYSDEAGEVRIDAFDDEGLPYGSSILGIGADETVHINSDDLEAGNAEKGLDGATGPGQGHSRLELISGLDIEVLAYLRTDDGFVTSMHDVVPHTGTGYHVAIFNPGGNADQVSRLRLINRGAQTAEVTIEGFDGGGESPGTAVRLSVPARGARTVTARELESDEGRGEALRDLVGALGDGTGKWRLVVTSDRPIQVMSLLANPTGHLTNLSTAPGSMGPAQAQ